MSESTAAALRQALDNTSTAKQPIPLPLPQWLTIAQVAAEAQLSTRTVRRRIADGTLPARRVGHLVRVHRDDVANLGRSIPAAVNQ